MKIHILNNFALRHLDDTNFYYMGVRSASLSLATIAVFIGTSLVSNAPA